MCMQRDVHPNSLNTKDGKLAKEWTNLPVLPKYQLVATVRDRIITQVDLASVTA